jgi:ribonuclease PH
LKYPQGSVLIEMGDTKVICTACVEEKVPPFLKGSGQGWITAEYSMLPGSNAQRKQRDISRLKLDNRSSEIQRLIGRSMRSVVDLKQLGERTIWLDCDVIQADGGTRVSSITGSFIALYDAIAWMISQKMITENPIRYFAAAVSVGVVDDIPLLDLCYTEDSSAMVDMNVVMTEEGSFIEIQATGEERPISEIEMDQLMLLATNGIMKIIQVQKETLGLDL